MKVTLPDHTEILGDEVPEVMRGPAVFHVRLFGGFFRLQYYAAMRLLEDHSKRLKVEIMFVEGKTHVILEEIK